MATNLVLRASRWRSCCIPRVSYISRNFAAKAKSQNESRTSVPNNPPKSSASASSQASVNQQANPQGPHTMKFSEEHYRSLTLFKHRKRNAITGAIILSFVMSVYFGSMYMVNQDPLDDIAEEAKPKI